MILFKPEHVGPILRDEKTHTRRRGRARWKVGAVHQARTNMPWQDPAGHFVDLEILDVQPSLLLEMTDHDARLEGYPDVGAYIEAFCRINRMSREDAVLEVLWDVTFKRVGCDPEEAAS